jgi:hypothetical protein
MAVNESALKLNVLLRPKLETKMNGHFIRPKTKTEKPSKQDYLKETLSMILNRQIALEHSKISPLPSSGKKNLN